MIVKTDLFLRCIGCKSAFMISLGDGETEVTAETVRADLQAMGEIECRYCGYRAPVDAEVITDEWLRLQPSFKVPE